MALIVEQESNFKYFCKICKKGFMCGRALGGHMRAHGIGDESMHIDDDDDDPASDDDWEEKLGDNVAPTNKRMYALRTNPNRLKSCRACKNCGKEFLSWKSFLEHGKCTSEDGESLVSPASGGIGIGNDNNNGTGNDNDNDNEMGGRGNYVWSKRKRSFRASVGNFNNSYNCPTREEEDLANCLMMLSNAKVDPLVSEPEESCASASKDEERRNPMNFISPLMQYRAPPIDNKAKGVVTNKGLFECKACKKVFNSHQALGGHRASHKKVKGCFAARQDYLDDNLADEDVITNDEEDLFIAKTNNNNPTTLKFDNNAAATFLASSSKRKSKMHECTICHRVFSSGQALGGHKRCHWITANAPDTSTLSRFQQFHEHIDHMTQKPNFDCSDEPIDLNLDLNLPAPTEDYYLPSTFVGAKDKDKDTNSQQCQSLRYHEGEDKNNSNVLMHANVDDEADSKVKLAKLSELKDMNKGGNSSHWLQVGIRSTTDVETNP